MWYLSVIHDLTAALPVEVCLIKGLWWAETDTPADLAEVRAHFARLSDHTAPAAAALAFDSH